MRPLRFALVAAAVFLAADALMIPFVMRPMFKAALGDAMLDELRLGPAVLFYAIHIGGLAYFSARAPGAFAAFLDGAMVGLVSYACYEMTSWTIMRDWAAHLVAVDLAWGVVLSGTAAGVASRLRPR
jgi:uncharacterized membrane protein